MKFNGNEDSRVPFMVFEISDAELAFGAGSLDAAERRRQDLERI